MGGASASLKIAGRHVVARGHLQAAHAAALVTDAAAVLGNFSKFANFPVQTIRMDTKMLPLLGYDIHSKGVLEKNPKY